MLGERTGPAVPFLLIGAVLLLTAPLKLLLPETLSPQRRGGAEIVQLRSMAGGLFASYRALLADPNQIALLALKVAFLCGLSLVLTVVPIHATAAWGASAADLGKLYSLVTLLSLVVSPLAGLLADRIGRPTLALCGSLATALSVACMPLAKSRGVYCLIRAVWALGEAFLITAYTALALDVTPEEQRGARSSLDNQVGDVALLVLPLTLGIIGHYSLAGAFWLASAVMLAANAVFARLVTPAANSE
jgi:MFS family permease